MSESLLFTDKNAIDNLNSSTIPTLQIIENTEEEQINIWSGIRERENDVCYYLFVNKYIL
jgi:hypothetical protein